MLNNLTPLPLLDYLRSHVVDRALHGCLNPVAFIFLQHHCSPIVTNQNSIECPKDEVSRLDVSMTDFPSLMDVSKQGYNLVQVVFQEVRMNSLG
jgi:hypothetical protein